MSRSDAEAFIKELMENGPLLRELNDRIDNTDDEDASKDESRSELAKVVPELAAEHGYDFTADEGFEALESLQETGEKGELSDVELEQVAGGKTSEPPSSTVDAGGGWASCK